VYHTALHQLPIGFSSLLQGLVDLISDIILSYDAPFCAFVSFRIPQLHTLILINIGAMLSLPSDEWFGDLSANVRPLLLCQSNDL
jgi:hypothetical protein